MEGHHLVASQVVEPGAPTIKHILSGVIKHGKLENPQTKWRFIADKIMENQLQLLFQPRGDVTATSAHMFDVTTPSFIGSSYHTTF